MLQTRLLVWAIFLAALAPLAHAGSEGCLAGAGQQTRVINRISLTVSRHPKADQPDFLDECALYVKDAHGRSTLMAHDHALQILPITGSDLNGDGKSEAVIEGWSGGMHCCSTYWIISLREAPRLLKKIYNEVTIDFRYSRTFRKVLLSTEDGRFDYFDHLCHACSAMPHVYMTLEGDRLVDVSPEFWPDYQKEIIGARQRLTPQSIANFREHFGSIEGPSQNPYDDERAAVLTIVLAYLYAGKPNDAWDALHELWPPSDEKRIRELIEKTRGEGLATRKPEADQ